MTDELDDEIKSLQDQPATARIARPLPEVLPPVTARGLGPVSPSTSSATPGSTGDLEAQGLASHLAPRPIAKPSALESRTSADDAELSRLQSSGSGVSQIAKAHPVAGNILRGLGVAGSVAGRMLPIIGGGLTALPGTEEHHNYLLRQASGRLGTDLADEEKEAQSGEAAARTAGQEATTAKTNVETEKLKNPQPTPKEEDWSVVPGMVGPKGELVQQEKTSGQIRFAPNISGVGPAKQPQEKPDNPEQQFVDEYQKTHPGSTVAQAQHAFKQNEATQEPGNFTPVFDPKTGQLAGAWDPKSGRVVKPPAGMGDATTSQAITANRQEITAHDKAYVQPAEAVEKSWQMMDHAYQEYEAARQQGKELPTGAQSMVALSTHLSTTFGNVKGARITKDMIQEHLGARGVSDSALTAIQKLTNGDVLSPDQWNAFHELIKQSRDLSWQTAQKEAERKHIPVDFMPKDLANSGKELGPAPPGAQEGRTGTLPDGTKVIVKNGKLVGQ